MKQSNREKFSRYLDFVIETSLGDHASDVPYFIYQNKEIALSEIRAYWKKFLENRPKDQTLNFYIHIPFCFDRCSYCYCHSEKLAKYKEIEDYLDKLFRYFKYFRKTFSRVSFSNLYIGGGTPSLLRKEDLERLCSNLFGCFNFDSDGERTCEMDLLNASRQKMRVLRKYGFNRISFGIQSFDQRVLELNNRGRQNPGLACGLIKDAKKLGFQKINADLMLGLYGDTTEKFMKSFLKLIEIGPTSISLYPLQLNTSYKKFPGYSKKEYYSRRKKDISSIYEKLKKAALENGYILAWDPDIFLPMNDASGWGFLKKDIYSGPKNYRPNDPEQISATFGLGSFSISQIPGSVNYRMEKPIEPGPASYLCSGRLSSPKMGMVERLVFSLVRNQYIDCVKFKRDFHTDFSKVFSRALRDLEDLGAVERRGNKLFFLSEDPDKRVACMLFFFNPKDVLSRIEDREKRQMKLPEGISKIVKDPSRPKFSRQSLEKLKKLEKLEEKHLSRYDSERIILDGEIINLSRDKIILKLKDGQIQRISIFPETFWIGLFRNTRSERIYQWRINKKSFALGSPVSIIAVLDKNSQLGTGVVRKMFVDD
jgi:coproporphyrinogen III oxidase-like Fe-S oxidoreductase